MLVKSEYSPSGFTIVDAPDHRTRLRQAGEDHSLADHPRVLPRQRTGVRAGRGIPVPREHGPSAPGAVLVDDGREDMVTPTGRSVAGSRGGVRPRAGGAAADPGAAAHARDRRGAAGAAAGAVAGVGADNRGRLVVNLGWRVVAARGLDHLPPADAPRALVLVCDGAEAPAITGFVDFRPEQ